jgi:hypothetical protein
MRSYCSSAIFKYRARTSRKYSNTEHAKTGLFQDDVPHRQLVVQRKKLATRNRISNDLERNVEP